MPLESDVRSKVREIQNGIRNVKEQRQIVEHLKDLCRFLQKTDVKTDNSEKEDLESNKVFMKNHYTNVARFLLDAVTYETFGHLTKSEFSQYFLHFFLNGCNEDAFLAVTYAVYNTG